jgi:MFS family permease
MTNPLAALMATLAVFAIGYLARPLGGLLFGHFGDRLGRKTPFIASAFLDGCANSAHRLFADL